MRRRLTLSFVILSVLLLVAAGVVRAFMVRDMVREQAAVTVHQEMVLIAEIVTDRQLVGGSLDRAFLEGLVGPSSRLEYDAAGATPIVVRGSDYDGRDDPADELSATADVFGGTVTVSQSPEVVAEIIMRDIGSVLVLYFLLAVIAGIIGFVISRALADPFRKLALAAASLGRGRFDLDLPRTRIPEALALSQALETSASQLQGRLRREREFAEHASHVLRTPLTGLRLELEDITLRDDVPENAREAAARGMVSIDEMNAIAGELVELSRSGSLVEGAEVPLSELATQLAQRWAERLDQKGRSLTASAEGDLTLAYTPGPIEHVLDLVLAEVVRHGTGAVRIVFQGKEEGGHLRIRVLSDADALYLKGEEPAPRLDQVRRVVEALGGRIAFDEPAVGLDILLPHR